MKILVTGSNGFIGKNLILWLKNDNHIVFEYDLGNTEQELKQYVNDADWIVHLAGINRPLTNEEFYDGNTNFTKKLVDLVVESNKKTPIVFASSIQATLDNDYGKSKKMAEDYLLSIQEQHNIPTYIYRFANVFGKWCKPNYNSFISTMMYNAINDLPINITDRNKEMSYVYIDDICKEFVGLIDNKLVRSSKSPLEVNPIYKITLGDTYDLIQSFKESRTSLATPLNDEGFAKKAYAAYLSYLNEDQFKYDLNMHIDNRGSFTEVLKTTNYGQVSINVGKPGVVKGNHYHHTKNEKFLVVSGKCSIKFRKIGTDKVVEYIVSGDKLEVVDIPTGYTHSITNIGDTDSVTLMWANESFDPNNPDTYYEEVINDGK